MVGLVKETRERGKQYVTLRVHSADGTLKHEQTVENARVDEGAVAMLSQMFDTATAPAQFNWVGLNTSVTAIVKGLTHATFTATEITTGGLARKQITYGSYVAPAALNANATAVQSATWTASAGGTIGSIGSFNGATLATATLGLATVLASVVTYASTDTLSLLWQLNQ
jgi:hypothetical protein